MLYTARIVFSDHHEEAAYTLRTALCNARIMGICPQPGRSASRVHARAHGTWDSHVTCQGRVAVTQLIKIHGIGSLGAQEGLIKGFP